MNKRLNRILNLQQSILENSLEKHGYRAGKTHAEISAIYAASKGLCEICGKPRGKRNHALDHDHATGRLRGILCFACNSGIGKFNDDPDLMLKAVEYISKYRK